MSMKSKTKKVASVAFTGVAAAGMTGFGLGAGPAMAASTWHIDNGTAAFKGLYSAATTSAKLEDTTLGIPLTCSKATAGGSVPASTVTGATVRLASVSGVSFTNCHFLTVDFTAKLTKATGLWGSHYSTTKGITSGWVGGSKHTTASSKTISAKLTGTSGKCTADVYGKYVPAKFYNSTHSLKVNSKSVATLTIKNVHSCTGIASGNAAYFKANFKIKTPKSLNVTGP
jgi:hypothetical protein